MTQNKPELNMSYKLALDFALVIAGVGTVRLGGYTNSSAVSLFHFVILFSR